MKPLLAPSILSADFGRLAEEVRAVETAGAGLVHVDVMDGRFVPNITIGPVVVGALRRATGLPLDCHLMVEDPDRWIGPFRSAGADSISVHVEAAPHLDRTLRAIRDLGAKAGVVLNPASPVASLEEVLPIVDFVLVMSVNPGFGGQAFLPSSLRKVRLLRERIDREGLPVAVEIDGGITHDNVEDVVRAGADWIVAGNAVFGSGDAAESVRRFVDRLAACARSGC